MAYAATYYVSKSGNDASSCTQAQSTATPKQTINNAVGCLSPGDTLLVRAGTYSEALLNNVPSGTSWTAKVRIAAYPGETVWMKPSSGSFVLNLLDGKQYIEFDAINLDGSSITYDVVKLATASASSGINPHHIRIKDAEIIINSAPTALRQGIMVTGAQVGDGNHEFIHLRVHGGTSHGFYLQTANNLVEWCEFYDLTKAGVQVYNGYSYGRPTNNTIRYNIFRNFTRAPSAVGDDNDASSAIRIATSGTSHKVYGNLIYDIDRASPTPSGIYISDASLTEIYNNTIYGIPGVGINLSGGSGMVVKNNISYGNSVNYRGGGHNTVESNNLFDTDPLFMNAGGRDFRLQTNSRAVDAGVNVAAVSTDLVRTARPQGGAYDLGAYETQASAPSVTGPAPPTAVRIVN